MKTFAAILFLALCLAPFTEAAQRVVSETHSRTVTKTKGEAKVKKRSRSGTERTENCDGSAASSTWVTERVRRRGDDCDK